MRATRLCLAAPALALFAVGAALQDPPAPESGLSIRYLANEGFLLRANGKSVLIDAFVGEAYHEYAALTPELRVQLAHAKPPFDAVDLALTSHVHRDHFQAETAAAYLASDVDVPFWSAEQVLDALRKHSPGLPGEAARLRSIRVDPKQTVSAEHAGLSVESFALFHVKDIQNLAHLIRFRDFLVLHVGDAVLDEQEYAPFELPKKRIDVAFLPYWYFLDAQDCTSVRKWVGAKHYVAMHVPPKEFTDVRKRIAANLPGVLMLEQGGEATRVEKAAADPAR